MDNRGGKVLKTGKIGRLNCLRQQLVRPGETLRTTMDGNVNLESLRERESVGINVQIHTFFTPMRWLWPEFIDLLREGPTSVISIPKSSGDMVALGIGSDISASNSFPTFFRDNYLRVYNEYFKWPEATDASSVDTDGNKLVPLATAWSRARDNGLPPETDDQQVDSVSNFTVNELAQVQARFRAAMEREVLSFGLYTEMLQEMFGVRGSREVDQVPILIDSTDAGVEPRDMPATDGASLGQYMGVYDFDIEHDAGSFSAPEHGIVSTFLSVRFNSVSESDGNPFAQLTNGDPRWAEFIGDSGILASLPPQTVNLREVTNVAPSTSIGFLPAGWQWRYGWNLVGQRIDDRNSFPVYDTQSVANLRDAASVNNAFRSTSLGDYRVNINFRQPSYSSLPSSMSSYMLGVGDSGKGDNREFITPKVN